MSNSSVAQVMVAQIGGAADSSSHPMQGPLSSAVCGSAQPTGGVSCAEDVLVDARLSAGRSSGSSNLRPRSLNQLELQERHLLPRQRMAGRERKPAQAWRTKLV